MVTESRFAATQGSLRESSLARRQNLAVRGRRAVTSFGWQLWVRGLSFEHGSEKPCPDRPWEDPSVTRLPVCGRYPGNPQTGNRVTEGSSQGRSGQGFS